MKIIYLDCFSGISGDMLLGAFIDAGLDEDLLLQLPQKLNLPQVEIKIEKKNKSGITATKVDVVYPKEHVHRHLADIKRIIDAADIQVSVKDLAIKIFTRLAEAEAEIHGVDIEKIHFHEVGALDAIIDITGAALAFKSLGVEKVFNSAVSVGGGMIKIAHGLYPVPAPATAYLLTGFSVKQGPVNKELVTPTGAAILSVLTDDTESEMPSYKIDSIGYGAGTLDFEGHPNVLRIIIGTTEDFVEEEEIIQAEFNVDDMNPQLIPNLIERTMEAGAVDAFITPITMKKGRPGSLFTILYSVRYEDEIINIVFEETTTIGIRKSKLKRIRLLRDCFSVNTTLGKVDVKVITMPSGEKRIFPEFESCKKIATAKGMSIIEIQKTLSYELSEMNRKGEL